MTSEKQFAKIILDLTKSKKKKFRQNLMENTLEDESIRKRGKALSTYSSPIVRHEFAFSLG